MSGTKAPVTGMLACRCGTILHKRNTRRIQAPLPKQKRAGAPAISRIGCPPCAAKAAGR